MSAIILVIHIMLAIALVGTILIQRSEGGGLGIGGGGMAGLMTGRATANLLTRATAILAALFMATSLVLALMAGQVRKPTSILEEAPAAAPAAPAPAAPAAPQPAPEEKPAAPLAQ
jgi:preprotein translocase subunit SecG